jgi:Ca2+-transporting ATPase
MTNLATDPLAVAHARSGDEVARALGVERVVGLDPDEVRRRAASSGPNALEPARRSSIGKMVWDAATEPFVLLLLGAGLLAVALGEVRDGLLILAGLCPIVGADVVTEYRGDRALEALRDASAPRARVRRGGEAEDVDAAGLVPGDIVLLRAGDVVPADLRILRADRLLLDRSALTWLTGTRWLSPPRAWSGGVARGSWWPSGRHPRSGGSPVGCATVGGAVPRCSSSSTGSSGS